MPKATPTRPSLLPCEVEGPAEGKAPYADDGPLAPLPAAGAFRSEGESGGRLAR
jgi:hypothetical protein